ncbi:MAG TPA: carbonic anhydrase family protein [Anaerolineales bacterium]|nr:carbonic anhydrase family protein [Anaerolineales bacterium]
MKTKILSLFLLAGLALSACKPAATAEPEHAEETTGHAVHWTYEGEEGPDHWGDLAPDYATCGTGTSQSPIDLTSAAEQDFTNISFHYQPSEVKILNNGHTVQVNYDAGSYIEVDGQRYDVLQFHYHAPSEHAVDGKLYAAELHIVHQNAEKQLAVVGLLIEEGAENAAFTELLAHLPAEESPETDAGFKIDATAFLPEVQTTFRYSGSLTTPPCSEGVSWFVMTSPIQLSADQIAAFEHVHEGNNRPVQPLNTRTLSEDTTP